MQDTITQCGRRVARALKAGLAATWVAGGFLAADAALAQSWPSKPLSFIVPFAAGSPGGDLMFRAMSGEAVKTLGQPIVVENRPGASGKLGLLALQKGKGNSHLIVAITNSMVA